MSGYKELSAFAARFINAVDSSHSALVIADADDPGLPIVYCNDQFIELTGYDKSEVVGRNCSFLQGKDTSPETVTRLRNAISKYVEQRVIIKNYRKDGQAFWNDLIIMPLESEGHRYFIGSQMAVDDPAND